MILKLRSYSFVFEVRMFFLNGQVSQVSASSVLCFITKACICEFIQANASVARIGIHKIGLAADDDHESSDVELFTSNEAGCFDVTLYNDVFEFLN